MTMIEVALFVSIGIMFLSIVNMYCKFSDFRIKANYNLQLDREIREKLQKILNGLDSQLESQHQVIQSIERDLRALKEKALAYKKPGPKPGTKKVQAPRPSSEKRTVGRPRKSPEMIPPSSVLHL